MGGHEAGSLTHTHSQEGDMAQQDSLEVPKEILEAIREFLNPNKTFGKVTISFKNGGISGVESTSTRRYK